MIFGVPKQIKDNETRVGMTPSGVSQLTAAGNTVLVEKGAGEKGGFPDEDYVKAGAQLVDTTEEVFASAEMILNVKEILPEQFHMLRDGQIIGAGLHTNANPEEVDAFLEKNITGIAYEDVTDKDGGFPGLRPSSPIAGKGAVFMAAQYLNSVNGGPGIMLADLPGIERSHVTVIGAGHAGIGAAETAAALGNNVTLLDINLDALDKAKTRLPHNVEFLHSNRDNIINCLKKTDVLINCVLWPKEREDYLIDRQMLRDYAKKTLFIADVSCDIDGAIETCIKATTHSDPLYVEEGIVHYTVDNIPAAYGHAAAQVFSLPMIPFILEIGRKGVEQALIDNKYLRTGLSTYKGMLTLKETAVKQNRPYTSPEEALGMK